MATVTGLVRFDGYQFRLYNSHNTPGLTTDIITTLLVSKNGVLWVGTEWGGFGTFKEGQFKQYWSPGSVWHRVNTLLETPDGTVYVGISTSSRDYSVIKVNSDNTWAFVKNTLFPANGIIMRGNRLIYVSQHNGIYQYNANERLTSYIPSSKLPSVAFTTLYQTKAGDIYAGTENNGLLRIDDNWLTVHSQNKGLQSTKVNCIYEDKEHRLWVGTSNGIAEWDGKHFHVFNKRDGLYGSDVHAIFEDSEGNLWVSSSSGLNRFSATKVVPFTLQNDLQDAKLAYYNGICNKGNDIWCATDVGIWLIQQNEKYHYTVANGLPADYWDGICVADDDTLWLWRKSNGYRTDLYHVKPIRKTISGAPDIIGFKIIDRFVGQKIYIRTACAYKNGLDAIAYGQLYRFEGNKIISHKNINTHCEFGIKHDSNGTMWIADVQGLIRVTGNTCSIIHNGLPPDTHVVGLDFISNDQIWMPTDKGLACYYKGSLYIVDDNALLADNRPYQVNHDNKGYLWVAGRSGIYTFRIADGLNYFANKESYSHRKSASGAIPYRLYTSNDGIRSYPVNFGSITTRDGKLWFPCDFGIIMVDPGNLYVNNNTPPVIIDVASVDNKRLDPHKRNRLKPGSNHFVATFSALTYNAPDQIVFRYRLEGFDNTWSSGTNKHSAEYTNLPPGEYRFVVTAGNGDGYWNRVGDSVQFVIEPRFYQTFWFKLFVILLIITITVIIYQIRVNSILKHNRELEDIIEDRTRDLRQMNEELQTAQDELTAQNMELAAAQNKLTEQNIELEEAREYLEIRVQQRTQELADAYDRTIEGWSRVMDLRDKETEGHSLRVTDMTVRMASALGMTDQEIVNIRRGALLHDIGKMGVPDSILLKPGPLTPEEWEIMRLHPVYAYDILSEIDFLRTAIDIPWCHHEKWDGTGYPRQLKGEEIPLSARLFCIVDVWDALSSDRPYRKGWPEEKVHEYLQSLSGTHFAPEIVELFFNVLKNGSREKVEHGSLFSPYQDLVLRDLYRRMQPGIDKKAANS